MMDSSSLLEMLKTEHMFFLPKRTLTGLCSFLCGYEFAYGERKINAPDNDFFFFTQWLVKEYMVTDSIGWVKILLLLCDNNDEQAFDLLFEKWEQFKKISQDELDRDFIDKNGNRIDWGWINIERKKNGEIPPDLRVSGPLISSLYSNRTETE